MDHPLDPRAFSPAPDDSEPEELRVLALGYDELTEEVLAPLLGSDVHRVIVVCETGIDSRVPRARPPHAALVDASERSVPLRALAQRLRSILGPSVRLVAMTSAPASDPSSIEAARSFDAVVPLQAAAVLAEVAAGRSPSGPVQPAASSDE